MTALIFPYSYFPLPFSFFLFFFYSFQVHNLPSLCSVVSLLLTLNPEQFSQWVWREKLNGITQNVLKVYISISPPMSTFQGKQSFKKSLQVILIWALLGYGPLFQVPLTSF